MPQPDMPRIVIDTREQRPWEFPDYVQTVIGTLVAPHAGA